MDALENLAFNAVCYKRDLYYLLFYLDIKISYQAVTSAYTLSLCDHLRKTPCYFIFSYP